MNFRGDVHHDPLGPAIDPKPWNQGDPMPSKKPALNPRIITKTVRELRALSLKLDLLAADLDAGADGRETQEKRRRKAAKR